MQLSHSLLWHWYSCSPLWFSFSMPARADIPIFRFGWGCWKTPLTHEQLSLQRTLHRYVGIWFQICYCPLGISLKLWENGMLGRLRWGHFGTLFEWLCHNIKTSPLISDSYQHYTHHISRVYMTFPHLPNMCPSHMNISHSPTHTWTFVHGHYLLITGIFWEAQEQGKWPRISGSVAEPCGLT